MKEGAADKLKLIDGPARLLITANKCEQHYYIITIIIINVIIIT